MKLKLLGDDSFYRNLSSINIFIWWSLEKQVTQKAKTANNLTQIETESKKTHSVIGLSWHTLLPAQGQSLFRFF